MPEELPKIDYEPIGAVRKPVPVAVRLIAGVLGWVLILPAAVLLVGGLLDAVDLHIWSHLLCGLLLMAIILILGKVCGLRTFPWSK